MTTLYITEFVPTCSYEVTFPKLLFTLFGYQPTISIDVTQIPLIYRSKPVANLEEFMREQKLTELKIEGWSSAYPEKGAPGEIVCLEESRKQYLKFVLKENTEDENSYEEPRYKLGEFRLVAGFVTPLRRDIDTEKSEYVIEKLIDWHLTLPGIWDLKLKLEEDQLYLDGTGSDQDMPYRCFRKDNKVIITPTQYTNKIALVTEETYFLSARGEHRKYYLFEVHSSPSIKTVKIPMGFLK